MKRLGTNHWLLLGAGLVLVVIGGEYIRAALSDVPPPVPVKGPQQPAFEEGAMAPDFALPDRNGKQRDLSKLVGNEALLSFVSDDAPSRTLMRYVASLVEVRRKLKKPVPAFVAIADFPPEREAAFLRETGLKQTVLYEQTNGLVANHYKGEARPRCFQFAGGLRVVVLGSSPAEAPLFEIGKEVLIGWGARSPVLTGTGFTAPEPVALKRFDAAKATRPPQPAAAPPGS